MNLFAGIVAVTIPIVGTGGYIIYDLYNLGQLGFAYSPFQGACHEAIKLRLNSPSSFKIISSDQSNRLLSLEESRSAVLKNENNDLHSSVYKFRIKMLEDSWKDVLNGKESHPIEVRVVVDYEALNGFGGISRGLDECTIQSLDGKMPSGLSLEAKYVHVNGTSYLAWFSERLNEARNRN
jgi:hypothetical protein